MGANPSPCPQSPSNLLGGTPKEFTGRPRVPNGHAGGACFG